MTQEQRAVSEKSKSNVKLFSELVVGKAVILTGGAAILADSVQAVMETGATANFNVHELETFVWGKMFVSRELLENGTTRFLLKVRGLNNTDRRDFVIPRGVVAKAIEEDASVIAAALINDIEVSEWIGVKFETSLFAACEKARIAYEANAKEPVKKGAVRI